MKKTIILHIETATEVCSVALSQGDMLIALKEENRGYSHAEKLITFIQTVVQESSLTMNDLHAVCLSSGPGSYTGLRIGASTAKGLCYTLNIPLISISTLESIVLGIKPNWKAKNTLFCPMIDAKRMEVYTALITQENEFLLPIQAMIIDEKSFSNYLLEHPIIFCGNGAEKCKPIFENHKHAKFDFTPLSAKNQILYALDKYKKKQFEDVAYFEPFYLKEYIPGKSTVKGLY
jgi:tRNA threonylcarbamoyladenosine biosynthesis protein TsaB